MTSRGRLTGVRNCDDTWALLFEYQDGGLDAATRQALEGHLARCFPCQQTAALFAELQAQVADAGDLPAPAHLRANLGVLLADAAAIPESELAGTWPAPETEAERIRRLSDFRAQRSQPTTESAANADIHPADAWQAREEMGGAPRIAATTAEGPVSAGPRRLSTRELTDAPSAQSSPLPEATAAGQELGRVLKAKVTDARQGKSRVLLVYATGIAATILIAILIGYLSQANPTGPMGDPGITRSKPYVQALLEVNTGSYRRLDDPTATGVERMVAKNPEATWRPIVFPAVEEMMEDPTAGGYTSADVWRADGHVVACALAKMDAHTVAIMASPWEAGAPIPGLAELTARTVDQYEFMVGASADRHIAMWEQTLDGQRLIYTLLVLDPITPEELDDMALATRLEIEQRARQQAGQLPG